MIGGLVAIVCEPRRSSLRQDVERMSAALSEAGAVCACVVAPELGFGIGLAGPEGLGGSPGMWPQPPLDTAPVVAVVEGEPLFEGSAGSAPASPPVSEPSRLAGVYALRGIEGLSELRGHWAVALIDRRRGELMVANDHFGTRSLFLARAADGAWLVASHPSAIFAYPAMERSIEPASLADYLSIGTVLGRKTLFRGVEMLPGAAHVVFRDGQPHERRYWQALPPPIEPQLSGEHLESLRQRVNSHVAAVARQGGKCCLALSGGMDARTILSALVVAGSPVQTLNHSVSGSTDAMLSAELARRAGAEHHFLEVRGEALTPYVMSGVKALGGVVAAVDVHALPLLDSIADVTQVVFTGRGSDTLRRDHAGDSIQCSTRVELASAVLKQYNKMFDIETQLPQILSSEVLHANGEAPGDYVRRRVDELAESVPLSEIDMALFMEDLQPKLWTKGDRLVRPRLETRHPLLDPQLFALGWSLPKAAREANLANRYIITRNAPSLAEVPYERTGHKLRYPDNWSDRLGERLAAWEDAARRRLGRIKWQRRPNYHYAEWFRGPVRPLLTEVLLDPRTVTRPFFRPGAVKQIYDEHMAGRDHSARLGALMALELTIRLLIEREGD